MIFKKMWSMRFMLLTFIFLLIYAESFAQTLTSDASVSQKSWEIMIKILFPALWTIGAPWVTGLVTSGITHVPLPLRVVISSVLGATMAGLVGTIPDFPLGVESAAAMGAAGGGTGQVLSSMQPETLKPKTAATQVEIDASKK